MTTEKLSISLPPELIEQVESFADDNDVSKSHVVKEALKNYLSEPEEGEDGEEIEEEEEPGVWESRIEKGIEDIKNALKQLLEVKEEEKEEDDWI